MLAILIAIFAPLIVKVVGAPDPNVQNPDLLDDFGSPSGPTAENGSASTSSAATSSRASSTARASRSRSRSSPRRSSSSSASSGLIAGYYRGLFDTLLTRTMDLMLAFPVLLLAIGLGVACADGCLGGAIQPGLTS